LWLVLSRHFQKPCRRMNCPTLGRNSDCWNQIETDSSPLTISKWFSTHSLIKSFRIYVYMVHKMNFFILYGVEDTEVLENCHFHSAACLFFLVYIFVEMNVFFLLWRVLVGCFLVLYLESINLHDSHLQSKLCRLLYRMQLMQWGSQGFLRS